MKQFYKHCLSLGLVLLLTLPLSITSFADVNDLLIASGSNAGIMTLDLDDYGISLTSSLGTVTNTISAGSGKVGDGVWVSARFELTLTNVAQLSFIFGYSGTDVKNIGGTFAINFTPYDVSSSAPSTAGTNTSSQDYQSDVSSSLSDLSSSVGSMSEDLESAAENLEYISQSQNLIIQGIDNVILHISDQLYAFWDQLYNLIHLPQMNKMDEIIAAIKRVSNDVDMSQVVQAIEDTTSEQVANDNTNTGKVEEAVKEHGNFIIEGLKGLFIPSDEFFKSYFDDLYEYFSDRFGFLSFPIDLLIRLVDLFLNSSDVDAVLIFPSFEISGEKVWEEQTFNFTEFMQTNFPFVLTSIKTLTSIGMIWAFVLLCQDKWDEVMRN